jgi:hypothetical protein
MDGDPIICILTLIFCKYPLVLVYLLGRRNAVLVVRERRLWRQLRSPCLPEMVQNSCYPDVHYSRRRWARRTPSSRCGVRSPASIGPAASGNTSRTYTAAEVPPRLVAELLTSNYGRPDKFARKLAPDNLRPAPGHRRHRLLQGLMEALLCFLAGWLAALHDRGMI